MMMMPQQHQTKNTTQTAAKQIVTWIVGVYMHIRTSILGKICGFIKRLHEATNACERVVRWKSIGFLCALARCGVVWCGLIWVQIEYFKNMNIVQNLLASMAFFSKFKIVDCFDFGKCFCIVKNTKILNWDENYFHCYCELCETHKNYCKINNILIR